MAAGRTAFSEYAVGDDYCEMLGLDERPARHAEVVRRRLSRMSLTQLARRSRDSDRELFSLGITFTVYSDRDAIDRVLPFDVIPRTLSPEDWRQIDAGVKQRVKAINLFLHDVYHRRRILKDGIVPTELVLTNANYRPEMRRFEPRHGTYVHIAGIDIVRDENGRFLVLEDNVRTPSGVSYVVENRHLMQRAFPDLMENVSLKSVSDYGVRLRQALNAVAPRRGREPQVVLLSPGVFNSAYFEHVFLAREMGAPLVEGRDLVVDDDRVFMKTTEGLTPVHVIYRRINDDFLDPEAFRADSMLGVPGLMRAYLRGNVTLANAIGTGVADDKAIYAYMPRIIRYYLDEEPILANVETNICGEPEGLAYTLRHLKRLVVKPVGEAGGYGVVIGPRASKAELAEVRAKLKKTPHEYISQPMVHLSVCPTLVEGGIEARHVDLRPFAVTGRETWVLPGGLTRVALAKGSMIVNSSQGGGTKDTWVFE
ncbi:MAG: circularly permuted type 2 ATP-grasp protein [Alphaproteobacteria bacterium]|jgi:uncharacterized circularly permuted ATP-grasp superfamily protein|nr:circularly permuted type 2 ATP-grasp protein [Alphaproteobacteria bacterium]